MLFMCTALWPSVSELNCALEWKKERKNERIWDLFGPWQSAKLEPWHLYIHSCIHSFIHACIHPSIHPSIYSFIYSRAYL